MIIRQFCKIFLICLLAQSGLAAEISERGNNADRSPSTLQNSLRPENGTPVRSSNLSRQEASNLARRSFQGRVISIRRDNNNWRVRMDQDGNVSDVLVNVNSGAVRKAPE